jgi:ElaB/YqjD/DUF883 family membrane-anchored ribosome-binding protein
MEPVNDTSVEPGAERGVLDRAREGATVRLSSQKDRATEGLGSLARAVRETSQPLRDNQQDTIAQYVEKAADQIERFSTRLRERNVKELVDDAQQFARRQPGVFIGAAFVAGIFAARFLKSSSDARPRRYSSGGL